MLLYLGHGNQVIYTIFRWKDYNFTLYLFTSGMLYFISNILLYISAILCGLVAQPGPEHPTDNLEIPGSNPGKPIYILLKLETISKLKL